MKNVVLFSCGLALTISTIQASPVFSDNFNSYTDGNLVGQGGWTITGTSTVNPIQVHSGVVSLLTTGQDAYSAFGSAVSTGAGGSVFAGLDLNVSAAQALGDYFLHYTATVGGTSGFYDKLFARSSGSGFLLGIQDNNGTTNWGSTVLSFNTTYRVVSEEDFVAGGLNDTFAVYVNPTDLNVAGNNTPYLTATWNGPSAEATSYAEVSLRQGVATQAPTLTLYNLVVSTSFSDVAAVPEPSALALVLVGGLAWSRVLRRKA